MFKRQLDRRVLPTFASLAEDLQEVTGRSVQQLGRLNCLCLVNLVDRKGSTCGYRDILGIAQTFDFGAQCERDCVQIAWNFERIRCFTVFEDFEIGNLLRTGNAIKVSHGNSEQQILEARQSDRLLIQIDGRPKNQFSLASTQK